VPETFATLINRSQKAVGETLKDQDHNPISVICAEVAEIVSGLATADLVALVAERPHILDHKPTEFYQTARWPSGTEIIRACIQMEIESGIDMTPFSEAVNKWFTHIFRPPQHLISKMQEIVQVA
jgi:hypothetical protein